uniref:Uncharacterized protein n=1 Tax=Rhizophora mucronata TaxID=61149 RepID=A0A2P2K5I5_RHIMU
MNWDSIDRNSIRA